MSVAVFPIVEDEETSGDIVRKMRQVPCLGHLPVHVLEELGSGTLERHVAAGETVFSAGQYEADDIFCCLKGRGRVTGGNVQEGAILRRSVQEGDMLGLDYVLAGVTERAAGLSLQAETEMVLLVIESDSVREVVANYHQAAAVLLREMARQVVQYTAGDDRDDRTAASRISKVLCDLAERNESGVWSIPSMPRHRELGSLADATEKEAAEAVARFIGMDILKRRYPGMVVTDYPALMAFAEQEC